MYYSVTFTDEKTGEKKNTWEDWHLIPTAPPMIVPPEPHTNYVEIPGRKKGPIDLSEVLSGEPTYKNSKGQWDFVLADDTMSRVELKRAMQNFIHGKRLRVELEEDPGHYWLGRFSAGETKPGKSATGMTIIYVIEPTEYEGDPISSFSV